LFRGPVFAFFFDFVFPKNPQQSQEKRTKKRMANPFPRLTCREGDITERRRAGHVKDIFVLVNAANEAWEDGGGVDGRIIEVFPDYRERREELKKKKRETADTFVFEDSLRVLTPGVALTVGTMKDGGFLGPKKNVSIVSVAGPRVAGGKMPSKEDDDHLALCYESALDAAAAIPGERKIVCFPGISSGVFGYSTKFAASLAIRTVLRWLGSHHEDDNDIVEIVFYTLSAEDTEIYKRQLALMGEAVELGKRTRDSEVAFFREKRDFAQDLCAALAKQIDARNRKEQRIKTLQRRLAWGLKP
jgi:O-acetyl-ADP-ribose deacetylase (regulator of RNase III)